MNEWLKDFMANNDEVEELINNLNSIDKESNTKNLEKIIRIINNVDHIHYFTSLLYKVRPNFLEDLSYIPKSLFKNCDTIKNIIIPDNIKTINRFAFYYSSVQTVTIEGNNLTFPYPLYEHDNLFYNCKNLQKVILPDNLTIIPSSTFSSCSSLSSIKLPEKLEVICSSAFYNCKNLANITLPKSLKKLETYAFGYCDNLEIINYQGTMNEWKKIDKEKKVTNENSDGHVYNLSWNVESGIKAVQCTDGFIEIPYINSKVY